MWNTAPYRSVKEIVEFLKQNPNQTESEIQEKVFGYYRNSSIFSNKKYADMLRRGLTKGLIVRTEQKKNQSRFVYNVAPPAVVDVKVEQSTIRNVIVIERPLGRLTLSADQVTELYSGKKCIDSILLMVINGDDTWENEFEVEFNRQDAKQFLAGYFSALNYDQNFIRKTLEKL